MRRIGLAVILPDRRGQLLRAALGFAGCRDAAEPVGRDAFHELRKDAQALTEYSELLIEILYHSALPSKHNIPALTGYGHGRLALERYIPRLRCEGRHSAESDCGWPD
jgi:hypothetical protein